VRWLPLLLLLVGCAPSTGLTIHNGTAVSVEIGGLPDGKVVVDAGTLHRVGDLRGAAKVSAKSTVGPETWTTKIALPPPGGEAIWSIAKNGCFLEGDFTEYYSAPVGVPATTKLLGMMKEGEEQYVSQGAVAAGPGERLPTSRRGQDVVAIVQVPCQATINEPIATGYLEMALWHIEPKARDGGP
jgi:hypothetical protein